MQKKLVAILVCCILANIGFFIFQYYSLNSDAAMRGESEQLENVDQEIIQELFKEAEEKEESERSEKNAKVATKENEKSEYIEEVTTQIEISNTYKKKFKPEEEAAFGAFFRNGKRRAESFDTEEYDVEWASRLTEQIFSVGGVDQDTGMNKIPNLRVLHVECKSTQCKVNVDLLGSKEENSIAFRDFQLTLLKLNKHPTKLLRNRMVHRLPNGDIYVSRGTND